MISGINDTAESVLSQLIQQKLNYYLAIDNNERAEMIEEIRQKIKQLEALFKKLLPRG